MANRVRVKTKIDLSELAKLQGALDEKLIAKVGLIGGKGKEVHLGTSTNNATIGLVHEFGSKTNKVPSRSFLRMPIEQKSKEIIKFAIGDRKEILKTMSRGNIKYLFERLGLAAEVMIEDAFATGGFGQWAKLNKNTIKAKGSSAPLIDTGHLKRAITSKVVKNS